MNSSTGRAPPLTDTPYGAYGPAFGGEKLPLVTLNEVKGTISSMAPFAALRVTATSVEHHGFDEVSAASAAGTVPRCRPAPSARCRSPVPPP